MPTETVYTVELTTADLAALRAVLEFAGWLVSSQSNRANTEMRARHRAPLVLVRAIIERATPTGTGGTA